MPALLGEARPWPVQFSGEIRAMARALATPPKLGTAMCAVCGGPLSRIVHVHHILPRQSGGDGRPSNALACHPEHEPPGCHILRVHRRGKTAMTAGWLRSKYAARPGVYASPVWFAWRREWLVLDDDGGFTVADLPPPELPEEMACTQNPGPGPSPSAR